MLPDRDRAGGSAIDAPVGSLQRILCCHSSKLGELRMFDTNGIFLSILLLSYQNKNPRGQVRYVRFSPPRVWSCHLTHVHHSPDCTPRKTAATYRRINAQCLSDQHPWQVREHKHKMGGFYAATCDTSSSAACVCLLYPRHALVIS